MAFDAINNFASSAENMSQTATRDSGENPGQRLVQESYQRNAGDLPVMQASVQPAAQLDFTPVGRPVMESYVPGENLVHLTQYYGNDFHYRHHPHYGPYVPYVPYVPPYAYRPPVYVNPYPPVYEPAYPPPYAYGPNYGNAVVPGIALGLGLGLGFGLGALSRRR
jgi:hypothetical protein